MRSYLTAIPLLLAACAAPPHESNVIEGPPPLVLPDSAAPSPAIAPLAFMEGRWNAVNPNGTVNEEIWGLPRGKVALGLFRQIRRDGLTAFVEVTQVTDEGQGRLVLRLRHLHGQLEVPGSEKDMTVLVLRDMGERFVEFTDPAGTSGIARMIYTLMDNGQLEQRLEFTEESGGAPFTTLYTRDGR